MMSETGRGVSRPPVLIELDDTHTTQCITPSMHKVLITGNFIELYSREAISSKIKILSDRGDRSEEYKKTSYNQSYHRLRSLLYGNFKVYDKFITFTFAPTDKFDVTNLDACNFRKERFLKKLRKFYPDVRYVIIPEIQNNRGAVHFHMICDLPYLDLKKLTALWGHGHVKTEAIKEFDKTFNYVVKYVGKDFGAADRFKGRRRFYTSGNLDRTVTLEGFKADQVVRDLLYQQARPLFKYFYDTPYQGRIYYEAYQVDEVRMYAPRAPL